MGIVTWGFGWYGFTLARSREEPWRGAGAPRGLSPPGCPSGRSGMERSLMFTGPRGELNCYKVFTQDPGPTS